MSKADTDEEEEELKKKNLDNYVRSAAKTSIISAIDTQIEEGKMKRSINESKEEKD